MHYSPPPLPRRLVCPQVWETIIYFVMGGKQGTEYIIHFKKKRS